MEPVVLLYPDIGAARPLLPSLTLPYACCQASRQEGQLQCQLETHEP